MAMDNSFLEKVSNYDKNKLIKTEIDKAIVLLKEFRAKYPFAENPEKIDALNPDKIFNEDRSEVGEFFHYLEHDLKALVHLTIHGSNVYRKIRIQIEDFKDLLHIAVDKQKTIAEKVDAPWEKIKGLGEDKHIAKKIIFCFNYESGEVLPIFSTKHMKHFFNKIVEKPINPTKYYTLGQEYEFLTKELLKTKEALQVTKHWEITYFARFLYESYPPPDRETTTINMSGEINPRNMVTKEMLDLGAFAKILDELQTKRKITGQQFREYRDLWTKQPQERENLTQRLKKQLDQ